MPMPAIVMATFLRRWQDSAAHCCSRRRWAGTVPRGPGQRPGRRPRPPTAGPGCLPFGRAWFACKMPAVYAVVLVLQELVAECRRVDASVWRRKNLRNISNLEFAEALEASGTRNSAVTMTARPRDTPRRKRYSRTGPTDNHRGK